MSRAQHYLDRAAALTRRATPPPFGCFTLPRFQVLAALEALLGLVFTNVFWVGLWDLLDNTIFPSENSVQMLSLVRRSGSAFLGLLGLHATGGLDACSAPRLPQVVGGALLLYFTNR